MHIEVETWSLFYFLCSSIMYKIFLNHKLDYNMVVLTGLVVLSPFSRCKFFWTFRSFCALRFHLLPIRLVYRLSYIQTGTIKFRLWPSAQSKGLHENISNWKFNFRQTDHTLSDQRLQIKEDFIVHIFLYACRL